MDQEIKNEIATVARDITFPAYAGVLRENDDTLISRGNGKGLKLYDEIERDCHAYAVLMKRKMAVIARDWQVDPASPSRIDKKAADLVRAQIAAMDFDHVCLNFLDALLKGFSVGENMWDVDGTELVATGVKPRDQRRFCFGDDYALRLKTPENHLPGMALPDRKFIVHSFGAKDGNPYGLGLGSRLFWPVLFKRKNITFWLTFLDKFGQPTSLGKYPSGAQPPEQQKLLDALSAIAQDTGIIVPEGMSVEFLEAARSGTASHEQLCRYMDEEITLCVLGEAPSVKGGGGQAASAAITRNEVRLELVKADADLLSGTLNRTLVKWITELNLPAAKPPRLWRKVEEAQDLGERAKRDKTIFDMGFRPKLEYVKETYGDGWEGAPKPTESTPLTKISNDPAFAEPGANPPAEKVSASLADQQSIKDAAEQFAADYQELLGTRLADLFAMLEETGDLVTFRERLAELLEQAPPEALTDSLVNGGLTARLLGATAGE